MGLTNSSVGQGALDSGLEIRKNSPKDRVIALAGNPNVGKSTVFNALTGMNQHTGNWPGKTVSNAQGYFEGKADGYVLVDIPGTYSLMAHSAEEEVARNFVCFGSPDAVVAVCDATALERNLNLVLQILEVTPNVILCVNLMDEAKRKGIEIDLQLLESRLSIPVCGVTARKKKTLSVLTDTIDSMFFDISGERTPFSVLYPEEIEEAIAIMLGALEGKTGGRVRERWLAMRLLEGDVSINDEIENLFGVGFLEDEDILDAKERAEKHLSEKGITPDIYKDMIVTTLVVTAEELTIGAVKYKKCEYDSFDRKLDRILTSKWIGYPAMLLLLAFIFWLTVSGANYPSKLLSELLFSFEAPLNSFFGWIRVPEYIRGALVDGAYRTLAFVVSVMLPPMAIFFPLFTFLEDVGYLPRVAYNLDKPFKKCSACGKQSLCMCMGFGCNAAGVVGCRIIDSPRERLLAILTNSFVPCNGRLPTLITLISIFFVGSSVGFLSSLSSALILTLVILFGIFVTFIATKLLSKTLLRGIPSSFALELPPYRKPQIGKIIVRSVFDRTLFLLGRAAAVAAPAGLIIWILANVNVGDLSMLSHVSRFLDPIGRFLGLDGAILCAFILGFPANEIVLPIALMIYTAEGVLSDGASTREIADILLANGWTWVTALCAMLFSLMHWPCSTTVLTIKKETGSVGWTLIAVLLPTLIGVLVCATVSAIFG